MLSLVNKLDEWKISIKKHNPSVILITESWLNNGINDNIINIDGYSLFRLDREGQKGGGICIFIKNEIDGNIIMATLANKYATTEPVQSIWLNVKIYNTKILIACIYRPKYTSVQANRLMIQTLHTSFTESNPVYIFGDFNYPEINWKDLSLSNPSQNDQDFLEAYGEMNACQLVDFDTRFRNNQSSLLDLILVNDKKLIFDLKTEPPIGRSDHTVILCKTHINVKPRPTHKVLKRNFYKANYRLINTFFQEQNFTPESSSKTKYNRFAEILEEAINTFILLKPIRCNPSKPWLTSTIFKEISKKRILWDRYSRSKTIENYNNYRTHNNNLKKLISRSRQTYEDNIATSCSSKTFFKYIKRTLNSKVSRISLKNIITNEVISNSSEIAEKFAEQFNKVFTIENPNDILPTLSDETRIDSSLVNVLFTPQNVLQALSNLKKDSSPGPDNIPSIFLHECKETLSLPLSEIMNECINTGHLPTEWQSAIVTPLFKNGNKQLPQNYRPISLTCCTCKIMEKIIVTELTTFLLENKVIPECQHGFISGKSTTTNLLTCLNSWTTSFDEGQPVDVIYLDFEKAFDKVPHNKLIYKLEHYGVRGNLLRLISNFLKNRQYQVRANSTLSGQHSVLSGVPQGSVLGPLLFLVYISDLADLVKSNIIFFADDTKLYANPLEQSTELREDLKIIESWCDTWGMRLNEDKCTVLSIGHNINYAYILNNIELKHVKLQKDLGVLISNDLKWEPHVNRVVKMTNSFIYLIQKAFEDKSASTILKLYKSFIRPKLEYAHSVWNPYYVKDIEQLERVQRRVTRIPPELAPEQYETRLKKLNLTSLRERRLRGDLIETYKILNNHYKCTFHFFSANLNVHLRGHSKKLSKEKNAKLPRKNFLSNRIVYSWNSLRESTVSAPTMNSFKAKIDTEDIMLTNTHYLF